MVKVVTKKSNFELMRIVSMLMIVIWHVIKHGRVIENCINPVASFLITIILFIIVVHVNLFILLSGYFQSEKEFKSSKFWKIVNASLFYKISIIIILTLLGIAKFSNLEILHELSIFNLEEYWFIKFYILLYILSPFLNKLIKAMEKDSYIRLLIILFFISSILPWITGNLGFSNDGYSLIQFIFMYFVGAFLKKYPASKSFAFKKCSKELFQIITICMFMFCIILNYSLYCVSLNIESLNSATHEISKNISDFSLLYSNPIVIVQSISLFLFFETLSFKNKFVNRIASTVLGVYMIHDNNYIRKYIYEYLKIDSGNITSSKFIVYIIAISILIFVACSLIEYIRQLIFKLIYSLKISERVRNKYNIWLKNIKFNNKSIITK